MEAAGLSSHGRAAGLQRDEEIRGEDASGLYYIEQNDRFDGPSFPVYFDDPGSIHAAEAVPTRKGKCKRL